MPDDAMPININYHNTGFRITSQVLIHNHHNIFALLGSDSILLVEIPKESKKSKILVKLF